MDGIRQQLTFAITTFVRGILAAIIALSPPAIAADVPLVFAIRQGDLHGLIDRTGQVIVPPQFEQPLKRQDGLIMAQKGTKTAFFDVPSRVRSRRL